MKAKNGKHAKEKITSNQTHAIKVPDAAQVGSESNEADGSIKIKRLNKYYILGAFSFIIALLVFINQTIVIHEVTAYHFFESRKLIYVWEIMRDFGLLGFVLYAPIAIVLAGVSVIKKPKKNKIAISALVLGFLIYVELFSFFQGFIGQLRK